MEPWTFDSRAMAQLFQHIMAGEFPPAAIQIARTDDDIFTTRLFLEDISRPPGGNGDDSQ